MKDIDNLAYPAFTLDENLKITCKNKAASSFSSSIYKGKLFEKLTDKDGIGKIKSLKTGESAVVNCFLPCPLASVAQRGPAGYVVRVNAVTAALMERAKRVRYISEQCADRICELGSGEFIPPENMIRLRRAAFLQQRLNDYIGRVVDPMPEEYRYSNLASIAVNCASAVTDSLSGSLIGAVCTGDLSPSPVFVSQKDIAVLLLSCAAMAFYLLQGRMIELRLEKHGAEVTLCFMFSSSAESAAACSGFFNVSAPDSVPGLSEDAERAFTAAHIRLLCELNGGDLAFSYQNGIASISVTFPVLRDDTLSLCSPLISLSDLCELVLPLLECFKADKA